MCRSWLVPGINLGSHHNGLTGFVTGGVVGQQGWCVRAGFDQGRRPVWLGWIIPLGDMPDDLKTAELGGLLSFAVSTIIDGKANS
jgi:hypothetical protein